MSKFEKLLNRISSKPKDFTWGELKTLLSQLGFSELKGGKTGGARVKFHHAYKGTIISLHKPHNPPSLKEYQLDDILSILKDNNLI